LKPKLKTMKYLLYSLFALLVISTSSCKTLTAQKTTKKGCCVAKKPSLETSALDSLALFKQYSYFIGHNIASDIKLKGSIDSLDLKLFQLAFKDVYLNDTNRLTAKRSEEILKHLSDSMRNKQADKQANQFLSNKTSGEEFFANLKKNDSIQFTPSGLAYKINKLGSGSFPKQTDEVSVHYEGKLLDGTIFDSSAGREDPIQLSLNRVIPGWTEGLQLIAEGGEIELYIPYQLGYGENGQAPKIEPFSSLIFKVELVQVGNSHEGHNHKKGVSH
jgi:FKBP-type peptidyl-prolyl cis-trans isomerase